MNAKPMSAACGREEERRASCWLTTSGRGGQEVGQGLLRNSPEPAQADASDRPAIEMPVNCAARHAESDRDLGRREKDGIHGCSKSDDPVPVRKQGHRG